MNQSSNPADDSNQVFGTNHATDSNQVLGVNQVTDSINTLTNSNDNVNPVRVTLGYPVHSFVKGKPSRFNNKLTDWIVAENSELDIVEALKNNHCVLFSKVDVEQTLGMQKTYHSIKITDRTTGVESNKDWGFNKSHIKESGIIACDFDEADWDIFPESIKPWVAIAYATPSAKWIDGKPTRFRAIFVMPMSVDVQIIESTRKAFFAEYLSMYPVIGEKSSTGLDLCVARPTQILYGFDHAKHGDKGLLLYNPTATIPIEEMVKVAQRATQIKSEERFEKYDENDETYEWFWKQWNEYFQDDADHIEFLEGIGNAAGHSFNPKPRLNEGYEIARYDVSNPFTDKGKLGDSHSMGVQFFENGIRFLDRATGEGMSIFHLCYRLFNTDASGEYADLVTAKRAVKSLENGGDGAMSVIVGEISNATGMNVPAKPPSDRVTLKKRVFNYLKLVSDSSKGESYSYYLYYDFVNNIWKHGLDRRLIRTECVRKYFNQVGAFKVIEQLKDSKGKPRLDENGSPMTQERECTAKEKGAMCEEVFTDIEDENTIPGLPPRDLKYIGFKNGNFNLETKQLEEVSPDVYVYSRLNRELPEESTSVIERFRNVLQKYFQCDTKAETFIQYAIAIFNNRGCDIKNILFIIGAAGSAKSTLGKMFSRAYGDDNAIASFTGAQLNHEFGLEGVTNATQMIVVEELATLWDSLAEQRLKSGWGNDESGYLAVNRKGFKISNIQRNFGMIADRQDIPKMPSDDKGFYRRLVFLETPWKIPVSNEGVCVPLDIYAEMQTTILCPVACFEFFTDCIRQNSDEAVAAFKELVKHDIYQRTAKGVAEINDPFFEFIEETFDVCEATDPDISETFELSDEVYDRFLAYFNDTSTRPKGTRKTITQRIRQSIHTHFPHVVRHELVQYKKRVNGEKKSVFIGVKFRKPTLGINF
ncbi:MAG: hypothetical protein ACRDBG_09855 [Waterburya sp.]